MYQIEIHCNADRGTVEHNPPIDGSACHRLELGLLLISPKLVDAVLSPAFSFAESISCGIDENARYLLASRVIDLARDVLNATK